MMTEEAREKIRKAQIRGRETRKRNMEKRREEYNKNPKRCRQCLEPIFCQENENLCEIKRRNFCNHSCSAIYNNGFKIINEKKYKDRLCRKCGKNINHELKGRRLCSFCRDEFARKTKGECKRTDIGSHAKFVTKKWERTCIICGYNKIVETAHIRWIKDFPNDSLVSEINHPNNLILLCPNCHWEYDHGGLKIPQTELNCQLALTKGKL